jgi:peptidoglycan/LPS O-acetylase OafA/YrhL
MREGDAMSAVDDPPAARAGTATVDGPAEPTTPKRSTTTDRTIPDRLTHQPALDGLRALAVLSVIFFHDASDNSQSSTWARGGFLGVDLFFVLSGFLITSLLLISHAKQGKTVTKDFWMRRARRLVPALLVLLVLVSIYAIGFAQPWELSSIRREGFATAFYVQNWYISFGNPGFTPLSHTWSLAIEEQWYLIWPLLLGLVLWLVRGRLSRALWVIIALVGASTIAMALLFEPGSWGRAYNGTDSRAFELLVGAGLAVLLIGRDSSELKGIARHVLEILGIVGFLFLGWTLVATSSGDAWMYRGGFLLVALAAAAVIAAAIQPTSPVLRPMLSWKPLTAIGLISYGLYLFHVPVFSVLTVDRVGESGWELLALRLLVTFAIAIVSYKLIEMPIRHGWLTGARGKVIVPVAIVGALALFFVATAGARPEPPKQARNRGFEELAEQAPPGSSRVLVAGEAAAFDLGDRVGGSFDGGGIRGVTAATIFCGIADGQIVLGDTVTPVARCRPWQEDFAAGNKHFDPDVSVLMVGAKEIFDRQVDGRMLRVGTPELAGYLDQRLDQAARIVTRNGAKLVILGMPCSDATAAGSPEIAASAADAQRREWVNSVLERYADGHGARYADLGSVLCPGGNARAKVDGKRLVENGRITTAGSEAVWSWLAPIVKQAERAG